MITQINAYTGWLGDGAFREGLVSGFLLILFSELGDKTFFIALLLALKKNKGIVFAGTFGALAIMTVISVSSLLLTHGVVDAYPELTLVVQSLSVQSASMDAHCSMYSANAVCLSNFNLKHCLSTWFYSAA